MIDLDLCAHYSEAAGQCGERTVRWFSVTIQIGNVRPAGYCAKHANKVPWPFPELTREEAEVARIHDE
jgi:hypothetical protein